MIHAVGLHTPHTSLAAALDYHGYVQIDPINVCGRIHDLILRNRVAGYSEGDLHEFIYSKERGAIESHHPLHGVLAAFPTADWRFLAVRMRQRASSPKGYYGRLTRQESTLADEILAEIGRRGPLSTTDFESGPRRRTAWGSMGSLGKKVFEKLFVHGRLVICRRDEFRRLYDLPGRLLSREALEAPAPTEAEFKRWAVTSVIRQRRLVTLRRMDVASAGDAIIPVRVEGCPPMFALRSDLPLLEKAASGVLREGNGELQLVAPLDPLIYDRKITAGLWGFEYTWEVYTPAAKRKRGYYALPILADEQLVGHVDPKADRTKGRLIVMSKRVPRGVASAPAVESLARFLGMNPG